MLSRYQGCTRFGLFILRAFSFFATRFFRALKLCLEELEHLALSLVQAANVHVDIDENSAAVGKVGIYSSTLGRYRLLGLWLGCLLEALLGLVCVELQLRGVARHDEGALELWMRGVPVSVVACYVVLPCDLATR